MRSYKSTSAIGFFLVLLSVVPGVWGDSSPTTDRVLATFGLTRATATSDRFCTSEDGEYMERRDEFQGNVSSTDPRMNGLLTVQTNLLINLTKGIGTGYGRLEIRDTVTDDLKLTGNWDGVITDVNRFTGLVRAELTPGGRLVARLSVLITPDGAIGNIGSPVTFVESDPAIIQIGSCSGGFGD